MKYSVSIFIVLLLVGAGVYFYSLKDSRSVDVAATPAPSSAPLPSADVSLSTAAIEMDPLPPESLSSAQPPPEPVDVTRAQREAAVRHEEAILDMVGEYEEVRSDPEKRQTLRAKMKQELAAYSDAVLPVALEKMDAMQSKN
tara:strand:- start:1641 stop:2066 length:426 start_codon:yes stop_codon:yes gene_type:complete